MDVFPKHSLLRNTSRIDPERLDEEEYAEKHVSFAKAAAARGARVDVRGGEALFMPAGTWHHVRAITPSFSVSYWW
jgi:lysine-specific demethylase 8